MYSIEEIKRIRSFIIAVRLSVPAGFWTVTDSTLQQICNGYGPDRWPESLRKSMTWVFRHYQASAIIHDVCYEYSDGTDLGRNLADNQFWGNLQNQWRLRYGNIRWVNPVALYGLLKIRIAYNAVRTIGKPAYLAAYKKRKE